MPEVDVLPASLRVDPLRVYVGGKNAMHHAVLCRQAASVKWLGENGFISLANRRALYERIEHFESEAGLVAVLDQGGAPPVPASPPVLILNVEPPPSESPVSDGTTTADVRNLPKGYN